MVLKLELDKQTEQRFKKFVDLHTGNYNSIINEMIDYRINELKKGVRNIELDFSLYERKYKLKTPDFYNKYKSGELENDIHNSDFMIWSEEFETYNEYHIELKQLA